MNVHAMSSGAVNSQLTQISNHHTAGVSRQNTISGQNSEEAMESVSEKAREASQRKTPASVMKNKINLYA